MNDYTPNPDEEFDWLASAIECANFTPAPIKPQPTIAQLLLSKARNRMYQHNYRSRHPDRIKARHALKWNSDSGQATANDVALQLKTQKGKCWWCGKKLGKDYHVDHRIPLAKGGSVGAGNIVCSCKRCNLRKSDKMYFNGRLL